MEDIDPSKIFTTITRLAMFWLLPRVKTITAYSTGDWGSAVENLISKGVDPKNAHQVAACYKLHSLDISEAYVAANWPEDHPDIYMELPSIDSKTSNQHVAHMQKMLYGLKDAGRNFE